MSNTLSRARAVAIWCMSMLTLGALHINSGADTTMLNGELLAAVCVVPPLFMLLVWRRTTVPRPATVTVLS
jgi:hypothetical protein